MPITLSPTILTFVGGVNRLLRDNRIIRGDDDDVTTFDDTQHSSDLQIAQLAIQEELIDLASANLIPYEHTTGTITLATGTRSYALATDFIRFFGTPSFYYPTGNTRYFEYTGGEKALMNHDYAYKTTTGSINYWYWDNTTTKKVAFYNVPDSSWNSIQLTYDYESTILVTAETDTLPFHNSEEAFTFISMASRRFFFKISGKDGNLLSQDAMYVDAKSRLMNLLRYSDPPQYYGKRYG